MKKFKNIQSSIFMCLLYAFITSCTDEPIKARNFSEIAKDSIESELFNQLNDTSKYQFMSLDEIDTIHVSDKLLDDAYFATSELNLYENALNDLNKSIEIRGNQNDTIIEFKTNIKFRSINTFGNLSLQNRCVFFDRTLSNIRIVDVETVGLKSTKYNYESFKEYVQNSIYLSALTQGVILNPNDTIAKKIE